MLKKWDVLLRPITLPIQTPYLWVYVNSQMHTGALLPITYESKYSRIDHVKFVEDYLKKIWRDMFCLSCLRDMATFLKAVCRKFYLSFLTTLSQVKSQVCIFVPKFLCNFCINFNHTIYHGLLFYLQARREKIRIDHHTHSLPIG